MLVLTHKKELEDRTTTGLHHLNVPKNNILLLDNYRDDDQDEDVKKSIEILEFIWTCLETGERTIQFCQTKKQEKRTRFSFSLGLPP